MFDDIPQEEHTEKNGWWINESLGVDTERYEKSDGTIN